MISNLGRKGGGWPHPKQHHPVPQGPPFSSINRPPEVHRQSHLNHTASSRLKYTTASRPCCHTARTRAHLISFGRGATPPHCNHIHFTPSSPPVRPYSTGVHCLINGHALTLDRPRKHLAVLKGHTVPDTCPPIAEVQSFAPLAKHRLVMPRPTGGNKTSINAQRDTAHTAGDTPTS
jgi:hypothetical protein